MELGKISNNQNEKFVNNDQNYSGNNVQKADNSIFELCANSLNEVESLNVDKNLEDSFIKCSTLSGSYDSIETFYNDDGHFDKYIYDEIGKLLERQIYDADGNLTVRSTYDPETGNLTKAEYYDAATGNLSGMWSYNADGNLIWGETYEYDPKTGNMTEAKHYDADGNLSYYEVYDPQTGMRSKAEEYDANGNLILRKIYDPETGACINSEMFS